MRIMKSKEDRERLKILDAQIRQGLETRRDLKKDLVVLKAERKLLKAKYKVKQC